VLHRLRNGENYVKQNRDGVLIAVGVGAASSASAAVSAPWPPTNVQKTQAAPGYGYAISKGNRQRMNHAPQIGEAHGSR